MAFAVDKLSLGIKKTFGDKLPDGVEFVEDDGNIFRLSQTVGGPRYIAYLVKIHGGRVLYQGISLRVTDLGSLDTVVRKVTEAIQAFRVALLAGTARLTEDGGLLELDPEDDEVPLEMDEPDGPRE